MASPMPSSLQGKTIVVTRPKEQADNLIQLLSAQGGRVVLYPTIAIRAVDGEERNRVCTLFNAVCEAKTPIDGLLFTSANAVVCFQHAIDRPLVTVATGAFEVFAIGQTTAVALRRLGIVPIVADRAVGEGVADKVRAHFKDALKGRRFLFPRARHGRDVVAKTLQKAGAEVEILFVYDTVAFDSGPPLSAFLPVDWVTFTSPSAARALARREPLPDGVRIACLGPTTAQAVRTLGWPVHVVPPEQNLNSMVEAMAASAL